MLSSQHLILFGPAQEIARAFLAAPLPVGKIAGGLLLDQQDAPPGRHLLAQARGFDSLEGSQGVFVQALRGGQLPADLGCRFRL